jgi:hypothetical protein
MSPHNGHTTYRINLYDICQVKLLVTFHYFRNLRLFVSLLTTDTQLPGNSILVSKIQKEATGSSLLEAFLESAPQLILQLSIILRTGIASEVLVKIIVSLVFAKVITSEVFAKVIASEVLLF